MGSGEIGVVDVDIVDSAPGALLLDKPLDHRALADDLVFHVNPGDLFKSDGEILAFPIMSADILGNRANAKASKWPGNFAKPAQFGDAFLFAEGRGIKEFRPF